MANFITTSPTIRRASELGCTLDCDLLTGLQVGTGGTPTDNTSIINGWLAGATQQTPLKLIIDGGSLVTGVIGPAGGHWSIEGAHPTDTGFFLKAGSNSPGIRNGQSLYIPSDPSSQTVVAAPSRGANIHLSNFFLNGNRGTGYSYPATEQTGGGSTTVGNGNSSGPDARGAFLTADQALCAIDIVSINYVTIDNVTVSKASSYSIRGSNVGFFDVTRCNVQPFAEAATVVATNTDGVHINGPANDIQILGCRMRTGDDPVAMNAVEGYYGPISRVTVSGCIFKDCSTLLRCYAANGQGSYQVDSVVFSNNVGTANIGMILGTETTAGVSVADQVTNVIFANNTVTVNQFCFILCNIGNLAVRGCNITTTGNGNGLFNPAYHNLTVSSLSLTNTTLYRNTTWPTTIFDFTTGFGGAGTGFTYTFSQIFIDGFAVHDKAGTSNAAIPYLFRSAAGNVINELYVGSIDSLHLTALCNTPSIFAAASVSGAGLLATGWQVPDAAVANNALFISATSTVPSIMIAGVRKTIGLS